MVFWDSRTIHKGTAPMPDRVNLDRWRFVIYVCYTPASLQTEKDKLKKQTAYLQNSCTSHWPYGVLIFEKMFNDYKTNLLTDLTERQRKCIGIID
jgi:hypothetical protein